MAAGTIDIGGLYRSERRRLLLMIRRIVRNDAAAEDLVHDSFVGLIDRGTGARNETAYLHRIASNLAIDHLRRQRHEPVAIDDAALFAFADPTPSVERALIDRQALDATFAILAALPPKARQAFELHRLGQMTLAEIAAQLDISTAHAGRLVMQGYVAVRDGLRALDQA